MGIIENGTISGLLSSKTAFSVHYPGFPSSMSRAVETLGGTEGIDKARNSKSTELELHFRPEDPYSHPVSGKLQSCNSFLLKISKNKSVDGRNAEASSRISLQDRVSLDNEVQTSEPDSGSVASAKGIEAQAPKDSQPNLFADVVAHISEAYRFDGMADYQHVISVHADVARQKKRHWIEAEDPNFKKRSILDDDQDDVMIIIPSKFSLKDVPGNLVFSKSVASCSRKTQDGLDQPEQETDVEPVLAIDFDINEIPKRINWEEYIPQGSAHWESQMAISRLFDERPIWQKNSLTERLLDEGYVFAISMLRRLLSRVAYYFSSGPFQRFWIKRGYDPREDPNSRIYQKLDFRVHPSLKSYCEDTVANGMTHRWEDICAFRVFPIKCHTSLQLYELVDDYIQQEIRKPTNQKTCTDRIGWFQDAVLDHLRYRIAMRFLSVYPKPGAEHLLKAATEGFEKSRKRLNKENAIRDEKDQQQADADALGKEDVEDPNIVEDEEEEEEEIEDDYDDMASNSYDAIDTVGDGETSLQQHSYINMDSISRTHLQELFGSFPSIGGASEHRVHDADSSDEEYQIFGQDSDGDYSNEDDG